MLRNMCNEFTKWGLSRMKNRDRYILKVNEYDMLMKIQCGIYTRHNARAIDLISGNFHMCPDEMKGKYEIDDKLAVCSKCIQDFLNEES